MKSIVQKRQTDRTAKQKNRAEAKARGFRARTYWLTAAQNAFIREMLAALGLAPWSAAAVLAGPDTFMEPKAQRLVARLRATVDREAARSRRPGDDPGDAKQPGLFPPEPKSPNEPTKK
jgi:hypothetical protein